MSEIEDARLKPLISCSIIGAVVCGTALNCSESMARGSKAASLVPATKLSQTHSYWGDTETIVSMVGVRINNRGRMRYCLVAKSPDWNVTVFRDDDKTFYTQSLTQYMDTGILSNFIMKRKDRIIDSGILPRDKKIGGVVVKQIKTPRTEICYLPIDHLAAPQVESVLYEAYRVPTNGGIPVRWTRKIAGGVDFMSGLDTRGDYRIFLSTKNIEHSMVSPNLFVVPKGYARTKSVQEVLISKMGRDASGDLDEMFEIGNKSRTGSSRRKP